MSSHVIAFQNFL